MDKNDINKSSEVDVILENPETPILTLNFKCSCSDYKNAARVLQKKFSGSFIEKADSINIISILMIILTLLFWPTVLTKEYREREIFVIIFISLYVFSMIHFYIYYSCIHGQQPFVNIVLRIYLKRMSSIYQHHTAKEIKKIIIPCEYNFYTTYFTKKTPSVDETINVSVDKISELPLSIESGKIEYSKLNDFRQNNDYITFCPRCFIPKKYLNEEDKIKLAVIIKKIISL